MRFTSSHADACDEQMHFESVVHAASTPSGWMLEPLLVRNVVLNPSRVLVRRGAFARVGGFSALPKWEDWDTWIRIAAMIFMLYWGLNPPSFQDLIINTFLKPSSLPFLIVGVGVGGLFAFFAFSISAISMPMLAEQPRLDVITAIVTSVRAVRKNPAPMLLWAVLIAAVTGVGLATLYLGLIVTVPLIGHATWHAYRDLVSVTEATEPGPTQASVVVPGAAANPST